MRGLTFIQKIVGIILFFFSALLAYYIVSNTIDIAVLKSLALFDMEVENAMSDLTKGLKRAKERQALEAKIQQEKIINQKILDFVEKNISLPYPYEVTETVPLKAFKCTVKVPTSWYLSDEVKAKALSTWDTCLNTIVFNPKTSRYEIPNQGFFLRTFKQSLTNLTVSSEYNTYSDIWTKSQFLKGISNILVLSDLNSDHLAYNLTNNLNNHCLKMNKTNTEFSDAEYIVAGTMVQYAGTDIQTLSIQCKRFIPWDSNFWNGGDRKETSCIPLSCFSDTHKEYLYPELFSLHSGYIGTRMDIICKTKQIDIVQLYKQLCLEYNGAGESFVLKIQTTLDKNEFFQEQYYKSPTYLRVLSYFTMITNLKTGCFVWMTPLPWEYLYVKVWNLPEFNMYSDKFQIKCTKDIESQMIQFQNLIIGSGNISVPTIEQSNLRKFINNFYSYPDITWQKVSIIMDQIILCNHSDRLLFTVEQLNTLKKAKQLVSQFNIEDPFIRNKEIIKMYASLMNGDIETSKNIIRGQAIVHERVSRIIDDLLNIEIDKFIHYMNICQKPITYSEIEFLCYKVKQFTVLTDWENVIITQWLNSFFNNEIKVWPVTAKLEILGSLWNRSGLTLDDFIEHVDKHKPIPSKGYSKVEYPLEWKPLITEVDLPNNFGNFAKFALKNITSLVLILWSFGGGEED